MSAGNEGQEGSKQAAHDGFDSWNAYWTAEGMPWRTEPEVDEARQVYLAERRAVKPDIERSFYPFRDENGGIRLTRADIEWLLATHVSKGKRGPVDWGDVYDRERDGVDLRGALLQHVDLAGLPLARMLGGLGRKERDSASVEQRQAAAIHLELANLHDTHFEDAVLSDAHLEGARLAGTFGHRTHMERTKLTEAHLEGADCSYARFDEAGLVRAHFEGANLFRAHLDRSDAREAHFAGASLIRTHLEGAWLDGASFAGEAVSSQVMQRMFASGVHLAQELSPADLREVFFDEATDLRQVVLGEKRRGFVLLGDIRWDGVNVVSTDWSRVDMLGDERVARQRRPLEGRKKARDTRLLEFEAAVRANRQLAIALRTQGLNEAADRFAYRAQLCQRAVLVRRYYYLRYLGSAFLDVISGYGYRPLRSVATYVATIAVFAAFYWCVTNHVSLTFGLFTHVIMWLGMQPPTASPNHLQGYEAMVVSMTSFHGRGFFQPVQSPGDKVAILAAIEAAIGLLLEITFIATFTQRFFAR